MRLDFSERICNMVASPYHRRAAPSALFSCRLHAFAQMNGCRNNPGKARATGTTFHALCRTDMATTAYTFSKTRASKILPDLQKAPRYELRHASTLIQVLYVRDLSACLVPTH